MRPVFIYALIDPRTGLLRYVGISFTPERRLSAHLCDAKTGKFGHRPNWIRSLLSQGLKPELEILAQVPESSWQQWEIDYIAAFRSMGFDLVNDTAGGEGTLGKFPSAETREKMRASSKPNAGRFKLGLTPHNKGIPGPKPTPETRAKMSAAHQKADIRGEKHWNFGNKTSPETRLKLRESLLGEKSPWFGKKRTPENCAKISASKLGKKLSESHCAAISIATRGENNPFFGKAHSPEVLAKIIAANTGKKRTPEQCAAMSASRLGKPNSGSFKPGHTTWNKGKKKECLQTLP